MIQTILIFLTSILTLVNSITITCIGDSITEGGGCDGTPSYTTFLQTLLDETTPEQYEVINAGVSSMTMLKHGLCNGDYSDCSYWNTGSGWHKALLSSPDIVTIMLGTNDAKAFNWEGVQQDIGDYYALDYIDMIRILKKLPSRPKIYAMVPPPLYEPYPYEMNRTIINTIFPTLVRDIARVGEVDIIDIFSSFNESMVCDGCHPNYEGTEVIANTIYKAIMKN